MRIESTTAVAWPSAVDQARRAPGGGSHRHGPPPMTNAAQALGMSETDLASAVRSGQRRSDIAAGKAVSSADLLAAVKKDVAANAPPGVKPTEEMTDRIAQDIVSGTRPPGPPPGGGTGMRGPEGARSAQQLARGFEEVAEGLGMDVSGLIDELRSGATATELAGAASSGLTASDVQTLLQRSLRFSAEA